MQPILNRETIAIDGRFTVFGIGLFLVGGCSSQAQLGPSLIPSKDQLTLDVKKENIINIVCQDASVDVLKIVLEKFRVEPAIPFSNKIILTVNYASVDIYYIHTAMDHEIGMDLHNRMVD